MQQFINTLIITIDGPAGVGKGTIARMLASIYRLPVLESGLLYRGLAMLVEREQIDTSHAQAVADVAHSLQLETQIQPDDSVQYIVNGEDVTDRLATESCAAVASKISGYPQVRKALLDRQRAMAKPPGLVAEGRDMGTVVFPDALAKLFLTASDSVRAQRRVQQLQSQGKTAEYDTVLKQLRQRDQQDSSRKDAPLVAAQDAMVIDTSDLTIDKVLQQATRYIDAQHDK